MPNISERYIIPRLAAAVLVGSLSVGCLPMRPLERSPFKEPTPLAAPRLGPFHPNESKIRELEKDLAEARAERPDCIIKNINEELDALSEGRDTYRARPIVSQNNNTIKAIEGAREVSRGLLKKAAEDLLKSGLDDKERSSRLSSAYIDLAKIELRYAVQYEGAEFGIEFAHLATCHSIKSTSLRVPYRIEELRTTASQV